MSEYAFYSFSGVAALPPGVELLPLPVRRGSEPRVFGEGQVRADLLPEELISFMLEYPSLEGVYAPTLGNLTWLLGMKEGMDGDTEAAARHLEMGLRFNPDSLLLRSNYALVLQLQDRQEEALEQYQAVLADPEGLKNPMVCLMAARLYAELERYQDAYDLLEPMARDLPGDDAFWGLLAEVKEGLGMAEEGAEAAPAATVPAAAPPVAESACGYCGYCGSRLPKDSAFCTSCGMKV